MRSKEQILAEALDGLIKGDTDKIPADVGDLVQFGLWLHNACPDIDPAFRKRLERRLAEEWAQQEAGSCRPEPSALSSLFSKLRSVSLWRGAATAAVVVALAVLSFLALSGLRTSVKASLSHVITLFRQAEIRQVPRLTSTPLKPERVEEFDSLEAAQAAAGFPLRVPSYLPEGWEFQRAELAEAQGQRTITLYYCGSSDIAPNQRTKGMYLLAVQETVTVSELEGTPYPIEFGPASTERLYIAGRPALLVTGNWSRRGYWNRADSEKYLLIEDDGLLLRVISPLGREENIKVAESLFG